jgi:cytoskeletal protein CcmA (bactofilin family)
MDNDQNNISSDNSLEGSETVVEPAAGGQPVTTPLASAESLDTTPATTPALSNNPTTNNAPVSGDGPPSPNGTSTPPPEPKRPLFQRLQKFIGNFNVYVLVFIFILIVAAIATYASYRASKKSSTNPTISNQTLSASDLQKLEKNSTQIGTATQTLTIASNSIFNGQVLMKNGLDVAGTIQVGGSLSLPGITVSGNSSFNNMQVGNNLSIAGNTAVQGTLSVQKSISVSGNATFGGVISAATLNVDQLTLNKDLQLNRHIDVGGLTPHASAGPAIGAGGTVSINGNDTAGTVNINFGSSPSANGGILANIYFVNSFNRTPYAVITPVGSTCASLNYYVNRNTTSFSIGTINNNGSAGNNCPFDYFVID